MISPFSNDLNFQKYKIENLKTSLGPIRKQSINQAINRNVGIINASLHSWSRIHE
jgi:hypothetical protein